MDDNERRELLESEDAILRGLLEAADLDTDIVTIEVARRGRVLFKFRIRPLRQSEAEKCARKATRYVKNSMGVRVRQEVDRATFYNHLIYTATVDEDRKAIWDNKAAWEKLGVASGPDLIDEVLRAGEKEAIVRRIEEISGFTVDEDEAALEDREREELLKD